MDFLERVGDYLKTRVSFNSGTPHYKPVPGESGIAILPTPTAPADRYLDRARSAPFGFRLVIKNRDQQKAWADAWAAADALDGLYNKEIQSSDDSFEFRSLELYTLPTFVAIDNHDAYTYNVMFQADILY